MSLNIRTHRKLRASTGTPHIPPDTYDVTIIVHPTGDNRTSLKINMPDIKRADILGPDYPSKGITEAVKLFEMQMCDPPSENKP